MADRLIGIDLRQFRRVARLSLSFAASVSDLTVIIVNVREDCRGKGQKPQERSQKAQEKEVDPGGRSGSPLLSGRGSERMPRAAPVRRRYRQSSTFRRHHAYRVGSKTKDRQ